MSDLLTIEGLVAGYGSTPVLHGVDLGVGGNEVAVVLGANGAGKTTMLRTVAGIVSAWKGSLRLDGTSLNRLSPEQIVHLGVGVVPAAPGVFVDLTVLENLHVGGFALRAGRRAVAGRVDEVVTEFPRLRERLDQRAGSLSGGEQRMLAVARALMGRPRLLLVDEASMGLAPSMVTTVFAMLARLRTTGMAVCMVEQNPAALDVADRAYVMAQGMVVTGAQGEDVSEVQDVAADLYLGRVADEVTP